MPTLTTNYGLQKPLVNDATDEDQWGGYLNTDLDTIDGLIFNGINTITSGFSANFAVAGTNRNQLLLVSAASGAISVTMPNPATVANGFTATIKKTDPTANTVTLLPFAAETFDGQSSFILGAQYQFVKVVSDGTNWQILASRTASLSDVKAGTSTYGSVTPATLKGALGFSQASTSGQISYTNNTIVTFAHGLGVTPTRVDLALVCQNAQGGYTPGQVIYNPAYFTNGSNNTTGMSLYADATNIYGNTNLNGFYLEQAAPNNNGFTALSANWKLVITAYA